MEKNTDISAHGLKNAEKLLQLYLDRMTLFDDPLSKRVFDQCPDAASVLIQAAENDPDIRILSSRTEENFYGTLIKGKSSRSDIRAKDAYGNWYNVEVQKRTKQNLFQRAVFNLSALTVQSLQAGEDYSCLKNTTEIFITAFDPFHEGRQRYVFDFSDAEGTVKKAVGHKIIFLNLSKTGTDWIGKLAHDFRTGSPDEMYSQILADRVRLIKYGLSREIQQGGKSMTELSQYAYDKILAESNGNEGVAYFASLIFEGFVKETEARVAKETETRVAKETEARVAKETETRVAKETEARVAKETETRVAKETEARVAKETETRVAKETEARLEKEFEARVEKEVQARITKIQDKR
jgi:hypothetical protein